MWAEYKGRYLRLVLPSSQWIRRQRAEVNELYGPQSVTYCTHAEKAFLSDRVVLDSLFAEILSMSDGSINNLYALLKDQIGRQNPDILIDVASFTGQVSEDVYFADAVTIRQASYMPQGVSGEFVSPGGFALAVYTAISDQYLGAH